MPNVILADRSDLFRRSMTAVLKREGYQVASVENGSKLLSFMETAALSVIVLDTDLEDPTGMEVLAGLKANPDFARVPVIVVSQDASPLVVRKAFQKGAAAFLLKPIDISALLKTLDSLCVPAPSPNTPVRVTREDREVAARVRFVDQYGQLYLKKEWTESLGPLGAMCTLVFSTARETYYQRALLAEENETGIALFPAGSPVPMGDEPALYRFPVTLKARYLLPGQFVRLANVAELSGQGLQLQGINAEIKPNSPVQLTLYPRARETELFGIQLHGTVTSFQPSGTGLFDAEVVLSEPGGLPFVNLLAELTSGRPAGSAS